MYTWMWFQTHEWTWFKVEAVLVWMYHRCEGKNHRNNKRVLNGFGMEALQRMVRKCYNGLSERGRLNAVDNVAMTDLSKDEESPEHGMLKTMFRSKSFNLARPKTLALTSLGKASNPEPPWKSTLAKVKSRWEKWKQWNLHWNNVISLRSDEATVT